MMTLNGTPEPYQNIQGHKLGTQSARTLSKHTTTQNKNPECKNHIKTYNDEKYEPRVQEPYQNI